ncbi:MAG: Nif3-like dinuclear metal center hexameric protein [Syntrophaceae bacterium]|jgi:hypothetical protein|nr:Nif3-like dinuclear metal center hexameric protein [Syntrophaceae bacterium]
MEKKKYTARDVLFALNEITGGRVITKAEDAFAQGNPFVIVKTSHLPGKAVLETPGLVCGNPDQEIRRLAVCMTLTESQIELAGGTGVDAIVAHHPVADAASCGGVPLRGYVGLYGVVVFELHEAFHGRHPGIAWIHGHKPFRVEIAYGGVPGNIMFVGRPLPEIRRAGDIIDRLGVFSDLARERSFLDLEREKRECPELMETSIAVAAEILNGSAEDKVGTILHFFPHTGFTPDHLRQAKKENPEITTALVSISRVKKTSSLVETARELGLTFLAGNSHALEIFENGIPLAYALQTLLPGVEIFLFRERVTSVPLEKAGSKRMRAYGREMAASHLLKKP